MNLAAKIGGVLLGMTVAGTAFADKTDCTVNSSLNFSYQKSTDGGTVYTTHTDSVHSSTWQNITLSGDDDTLSLSTSYPTPNLIDKGVDFPLAINPKTIAGTRSLSLSFTDGGSSCSLELNGKITVNSPSCQVTQSPANGKFAVQASLPTDILEKNILATDAPSSIVLINSASLAVSFNCNQR